MTSPLLNLLGRRVVFVDGSMGATIQNIDLEIDRDYLGRENCVDLLVRSRPDLLQQIHESFLEVGADCVETNTFGANKLVFAEFDEELVSWTYDLNKEAAQIARAACDCFATKDNPRFVLGSMGPGTKLITLGQTTWEAMLDSYRTQALGLIDGGCDAFIIETCQDLLQVKCAINACLAALEERNKTPHDVPIMVSVTIETNGTMLVGSEISAAMHALKPYPIASLGLNCATGPVEMEPHLAYLAKHWDRHLSVIPNAGLPSLVKGRTEFPLKPEPMSDALARFVDQYGVNIVGGCCGTEPEHIRFLVDSIGKRPPGEHTAFVSPAPSATSLYQPVEYRQELSFFIVGERMNASGSRKFKRLLEEENWDEMISLAREQVRDGANCLDVNVDYAGRDNARDMAEIVARVARQVDCPLMIDSTQHATIEAGLKHAPGKCVINSTNFEDGEEKFDAVCALAKKYGAAVVIGSIDEDPEAAMARTADRKFAIASRAFDRATKQHGLAPEDLFFDPLVLPISTGMDEDRRSALELIEGTRRISAAYPQCQIICGLSNVSFGLKPAARVVLNSVFMHELLEAGMTGAIVHASKIVPLNRIDDEQRQASLELIYNRRENDEDPLNRFIELFTDVDHSHETNNHKERTLDEWLRDHIIEGEKQDLHLHLDEALEHYSALEIINEHLLHGMKTVGELFGSGQMQLPFVLQSAEVMKMAVTYLEPHMDKEEGSSKGTIVLATVKGDVHDIGKNLVDIILSNNGYSVVNLGIKRPIEDMIEAFREHDADAIGMSGLLVKSVNVMEENLNALNQSGLNAPVLLGGAALSRHYAESHLRSVYDGKLYYGRDAFEGLRICEHLTSNQLDALEVEIDARERKRERVESRAADLREREASQTAVAIQPVALRTDVDIPTPPFWGDRLVEQIDLDDIYPFINTAPLFRGQWGFKKGSRSSDEYDREIKEIVEPIFRRLKQQCAEEKILRPKVVYGYYPCSSGDSGGSGGDDLIVFDPEDHGREIERFTFPRQDKRNQRCLADYFRSASSSAGGDARATDVVAFTCVTMGIEVSHRARQLFERNEYTEYLYLHGLGVEAAEALAELWHQRVRTELGIAADDSPDVRGLFQQKYRGCRYSFGYPACPDLSDQEKLFRLLKPERIGCVLTDNWQIDPEQSTSALIVHHPDAKYFTV